MKTSSTRKWVPLQTACLLSSYCSNEIGLFLIKVLAEGFGCSRYQEVLQGCSFRYCSMVQFITDGDKWSSFAFWQQGLFVNVEAFCMSLITACQWTMMSFVQWIEIFEMVSGLWSLLSYTYVAKTEGLTTSWNIWITGLVLTFSFGECSLDTVCFRVGDWVPKFVQCVDHQFWTSFTFSK